MTVLSNINLPVDTTGVAVLTGEADVLLTPHAYYFYFNNWGGCPGVDCCGSSGGCAACCFNPPSVAYPDACVYTSNHTVEVYEVSLDLQTWVSHGEALPATARREGIEFRPHVVYNAMTDRYVMWYEDRWDGQSGYAVATSPNATGPFVTISNSTGMTTSDKIGDFDIFVDPDTAIAFHVRTGFAVEQLNEEYTASTGNYTQFQSETPSEGPVMFKREGLFYILVGSGCCACRGGSNIQVFTSTEPLGNYTFRGDVGTNPGGMDPPYNYATNAQASAVFTVPESGELVWVGNQWVTSELPGAPRNNDLLYWHVLEFDDETGDIQQIVWSNTTSVRTA